jgi:hypothetical protein
MAVHIVTQESYDLWNGFDEEAMLALCGTTVQREQGAWSKAWTEFPCNRHYANVCPECREHPEYAMMLLAGRNLNE